LRDWHSWAREAAQHRHRSLAPDDGKGDQHDERAKYKQHEEHSKHDHASNSTGTKTHEYASVSAESMPRAERMAIR
jgi:hypothetical protein